MNLSLPKRVTRLHQNGFTQRRIAEELGISQTTVRRYLAGWQPRPKRDSDSTILATARRLLREAKTEAERECVRNNFKVVLEEA